MIQVLSCLEPDHPLRNAPLGEIGAKYKNTFNDKAAWRAVLPSFGIANSTYNELSDAWTSNSIWIADDGEPDAA